MMSLRGSPAARLRLPAMLRSGGGVVGWGGEVDGGGGGVGVWEWVVQLPAVELAAVELAAAVVVSAG